MTQHARSGEYKLQRQHAGVGYFGQVKLGVAPSDEAAESTVEWAVPADDRTSMQPRSDSEFVTAALDGARRGIELVGEAARGCRIDVLHVQVNLIDIEESAVRAAATLAVANAFDVADRFELRFDGGWQVEPT